jgi:hypothetical protein
VNTVAITVREVTDGAGIVRALFRHRYGVDPPAIPHHVIAFHRLPGASEVPVGYVHFTALGDLLLGGGACVDDRAMRRMDAETRTSIRMGGGLYRMTLDWAVRHFAPTYAAIFGYCGDALAERIDLAAGFEPTGHAHLLVHWTHDVARADRERLICRAHAIGPF